MWIQLFCVMQFEIFMWNFLLVHGMSSQHLKKQQKKLLLLFSFKLVTLSLLAWSILKSPFIRLMACFSSQVDFTSCGGFLCIAAVLLMIIGIITAIVLSFQYVRTLVVSCNFFSLFMFLTVSGSRKNQYRVHIQRPFLCHPTGPLAAYALCCNWSHRLHPGGSTLTWI